MSALFGPIYQIAFVVADLDHAIAAWIADRCAGPFYRFDHFAFLDPWSAGGARAPDISIALGQSGDLNIELIEVHGTPPPLFADGPGFHHVARRTEDIDRASAALLETGGELVFAAMFPPAVRMAFVDTRAAIGCRTELIAADAGIDAMLARMREEAAAWDGRDPVRRF